MKFALTSNRWRRRRNGNVPCRAVIVSFLLWEMVLLLSTSDNTNTHKGSSMVFFVTGHVRMECPPPQSGKSGEKRGPCDVNVIDSMLEEDEDNESIPAYPLIPGALNTVTWLESIPHPGAPVRFALSRDVGDDASSKTNEEDDDFFGSTSTSTMDMEEYAELFTASFESCLLLDHVPHDAHSQPNYRNESTWHRSSITLWIPDIKCERCHLQLISIMSDEMHGVPQNTKCSYKNKIVVVDNNNKNDNITDTSEEEEQEQEQYPDCPAVYHSCSPVSINGTIPRNEIEHCNTTEFEEKLGWPFTPRSEIGFNIDHDGDDLVSYDQNDDSDLVYEYSTYWNRGDVGLFSDSEARLLKAGAPLTECDSPQYCDPNEYFETIFVVPETAAYTALEGSCAAITGMEVAPFQSGGILPSVPKRQKQAQAVATTDAGNGTVPDSTSGSTSDSTTGTSTSGSSGTNPTNDTTITDGDGEEKLVTDEKNAAVIVADKNDAPPTSSSSSSSSSDTKNNRGRSMLVGWVVVAGIFSMMKW
mmetsp:Transcript_28796/g.32997  ORF Transcript_28796/g.32997 Transcript_28796/m.32997 type:complete len:529 (+) Transcript_28796:59-1645(+)